MGKKNLTLISIVVAVHLFFFLFDFKEKTPPPPPKKSIVVNTYTPPPPAPAPKKRSHTSSPQHKGAVSSKGKAPLAKKNALLKDLKETLSNIETHSPPDATLSLPKKIQNLQIDQGDRKEKTDYVVSLAQVLKEGLELPEHGVVKLELTVSQSGRVLKLQVLHTASEKNKRYLELNLPQISLPPFNEELKNESEHTFTLTFCNAP
ncbi:MAG: hypothetical protein KDK76_05800 [Chlamydiia bacterium]|nr:hypothetical protein [Chlamydiia bacterium]